VRVDRTCFFHAVNQDKTGLQVILPRGCHHTRTYSLSNDREAEEVGHVLKRRSNLPTREVERVCLRPLSINESRQEGSVELYRPTLDKTAQSQ
jgi:hypothetical protein